MTLRILVATIAASLAIVEGAMTAQVPHAPQFRTRVDALRLAVRVVHDGRPVLGLKPDDFRVSVGEVQHSVTSAAAITALNVALLFDQSRSLATQGTRRVAEVGALVAGGLEPQESLRLYGFNEDVRRLVPPTTDRTPVTEALGAAVPSGLGTTAFWDALIAVAADMAGAPDRPYVVALTDGCDNGSWLAAPAAARWLGATGVTADVVFYGSSETENRSLNLKGDACHGPLRLEEGVHDADGRVWRTADRQLERKLQERLASLRQGYFVAVTPAPTLARGGWLTVSVRLRPGLHGKVSHPERVYVGDFR
jgi:hypothetical protein